MRPTLKFSSCMLSCALLMLFTYLPGLLHANDSSVLTPPTLSAAQSSLVTTALLASPISNESYISLPVCPGAYSMQGTLNTTALDCSDINHNPPNQSTCPDQCTTTRLVTVNPQVSNIMNSVN